MVSGECLSLGIVNETLGTMKASNPKFPLGQVVTTASVYSRMGDAPYFHTHVNKCLKRHAECDWGTIMEDSVETNNKGWQSGENQERLHSAYEDSEHPTLWIITEQDRSATTVLFPSEY